MKPEPLKVGDTYVSESLDPWSTRSSSLLKAEIIDLRDNWVRYKSWLGDSPPNIFTAPESYFRNCYQKKV